MIVNRDYRRNLAAREATQQERRRTRQRALLVTAMVGLALVTSGLVRLSHWAQTQWRAGDERGAAVATVEESPAPAETEDEPPKYDFYDVLPNQSVVITDDEIIERPMRLPPDMLAEQQANGDDAGVDELAAASTLGEGVGEGGGETPKGYLIQAGAFGDPAKADQMRARIAGLGFAARVEPVQVNGRTLNRVRLGPFTDRREVEAMRIRLKSDNIDINIINRY